MKKYISSRNWLLFLAYIGLILSAGCGSEEKCEGCDKDAPWSNVDAPYCYPTQNQCETETGATCEKCD